MDQKNHENKTPPKEAAFQGRQLDLFQDFLCNTDQEKDNLSNAIELWDAVPKYHISKRQQGKIRKDGFLPTATHDFVYKGKNFNVKIRPALLTVDGKDKAFYPSAREELVEDVLRKLACKKGNGYFETERSGVAFTSKELQGELKKRGHSCSFYEVMESLDILSSTTIEISPLNGKALYKSSPLTCLIGVSKEDLLDDPKARWYADFSPLVTEGIKEIKYRQYNYGKMMGHKSQLTRYLHKRLAYNYVQAGILEPYTITLRGISRDSGLLVYKRANDNWRKLEGSLNELVEEKILMRFETEKKRGERNALIDVRFTLLPHLDFVSEAKRANKRLRLTTTR